ncbi:MAG: hypothetical protein ACI9SB_001315, partial [Candidatus Azotimanducaceae bacterium]
LYRLKMQINTNKRPIFFYLTISICFKSDFFSYFSLKKTRTTKRHMPILEK